MKEIIIELEVSEPSKIIELPVSDNGVIELNFTYLDDELETDEFEDQEENVDAFVEDEDIDNLDIDDVLNDNLDI